MYNRVNLSFFLIELRDLQVAAVSQLYEYRNNRRMNCDQKEIFAVVIS